MTAQDARSGRRISRAGTDTGGRCRQDVPACGEAIRADRDGCGGEPQRLVDQRHERGQMTPQWAVIAGGQQKSIRTNYDAEWRLVCPFTSGWIAPRRRDREGPGSLPNGRRVLTTVTRHTTVFLKTLPRLRVANVILHFGSAFGSSFTRPAVAPLARGQNASATTSGPLTRVRKVATAVPDQHALGLVIELEINLEAVIRLTTTTQRQMPLHL